ncbi:MULTISPECIES: response regulator transcription factor [unclassified Paraburkholderia]|uniref:response regulator transcription factor n=1 Tax=unclassified Paraburkholderia TaxID=2615204 RepID=UPI001610CA9B|nr:MULTISPECIES: response regulator [unclassified Paraburkholderia]MBB5497884.1 FixJ family two-component response regulator [Paraburkholderia sp. MM5384-R2]MBC8731726.1 response regulator transcription factor [Paraburkholderia sp. UCT2]
MIDHAATVIHVVDDDPAMRTALTRLLTQAGYTVKGYPSAGEFLVADLDPSRGCLLLDLELPGPGGLDLQHALQRLGRQMPIVFISAHRDIPRTVMAIKAGACDFLVKPIEAQTLFAAIDNALAAAVVVPSPAEPGKLADAHHLNARELVVLRGIVAGRLNKQIAAELAVSERTIKSCRADLMRKLHANSFADLVILAEPIVRAHAST